MKTLSSADLPQKASVLTRMIVVIALVAGELLAFSAPGVQAAGLLQEDLIPFEAPNGMFTIQRLALFSDVQQPAYEQVANQTLEDVTASRLYAFLDEDLANGTIVFLLLRDEDFTTDEDWIPWVNDFLVSTFGEDLQGGDLSTAGEGDFTADYRLDTDEFTAIVHLEERQGVILALVHYSTADFMVEHEKVISQSSASLTWDPKAVRDVLQGRVVPEAEGPLPAFSRYEDPRGVFSLDVPEPFMTGTPQVDDANGYSVLFSAGSMTKMIGVMVNTASQALEDEDRPTFKPVDDDEWETLLQSLRSSFTEDEVEIPVFLDNQQEHTLYMAVGDQEGQQVHLWLEESEGVVFLLLSLDLNAEGNLPLRTRTFDHMISSLAWHPQQAISVLQEVHGLEPEVPEAVPFDDPFELVSAEPLPDYPFNQVAFDGTSLRYRFAAQQEDGGFFVNFDRVADGPLDEESWSEAIADLDATIRNLAASGSGKEAELLGSAEAEDKHEAVALAKGENWYGGILVREDEGLLVSHIVLLPPDVWEAQSDQVRTFWQEGVVFDQAEVLAALDGYASRGVLLDEAKLSSEFHVDGTPGHAQYTFAPDEQMAFAFHFSDLQDADQVDLLLWAEGEDHPFAQFNLLRPYWSALDGAIQVIEDDQGVWADFTYRPPVSLRPGLYRAGLLHSGELVAAFGFQIEVPSDVTPALRDMQLTADADAAAHPLSPTAVFTPTQTVYAVGRADLPPDAQVRVNWFQEGSLVLDAVQILNTKDGRLDTPGGFFYRPQGGWETGAYSVTVAVNGAVLWQGDFTVVLPDEAPRHTAAFSLPEFSLDEDALADLTIQAELPLDAPLQAALSPDGRWLAVIDDGGFQLYSTNSLEPVDFPDGLIGASASAFAWEPSGAYLAVVTTQESDAGPVRAIQVWDASNWGLLTSLYGHANTVTELVWAPRDPALVSVSMDATARTWTLGEFDSPRILPHQVRGMQAAFLMSGDIDAPNSLLATGIRGGLVQFWHANHAIEPGSLVQLDGSGEPKVRFLGDSGLFAAAAGDKVELWRYERGQPEQLAVFPEEDFALWDFEVSPEGNWIVLAGRDGLLVYTFTADGPALLKHYNPVRDDAGDPIPFARVSIDAQGKSLVLLLADGRLLVVTGSE